MAGRPDPTGIPPGPFGAIRQGGGGNTAGPSFGGGGNTNTNFFPQRGNQNNIVPGTSTAGFGFNAGPLSNMFQQLQGGNGSAAFPQPSQGGLGFASSQNNPNTAGGFAGNGPRRAGQGNGNQRQFRSSNYRGGRNSYRNKSSSNRSAESGDTAGNSSLAHKKANPGESSSANASGGFTDNQAEGKKKAKKESCYRCGSNGHLFFECTVVLCEYCEQVGHKPDDCHLLSAPNLS
jgi:hypothetical protein